MTFNPDTEAIYDEAIELQSRVEKFESERLRFIRLERDKALQLLSDGFMVEADPQIRLEGVKLKANQDMQAQEPELYEYLDNEFAAITAIRNRNEAIVAAGWAESFAINSAARNLYAKEEKRLDEQKPQELEP